MFEMNIFINDSIPFSEYLLREVGEETAKEFARESGTLNEEFECLSNGIKMDRIYNAPSLENIYEQVYKIEQIRK